MTEIPEHLLKRAQARRAAMSGGSADEPSSDAPVPAASGDAAPAAAPAKAKAPAPLPTLDSEPDKVEPDIPVVAAAKARKKVPFWIAPILMLLPIWGWIYRDAVTEKTSVETNPITIGAGLYPTCAGCHGADGAGGPAGAQFNEGHTIETFADPLSMAHWISYGWAEGRHANDTYGDVDRPQIAGSMPGFRTSLSASDIAALTIYIRSEFGGDLYDPENERGFTVEAYEADPDALAAQVQAVIDLGPGGEPDVESIERAE